MHEVCKMHSGHDEKIRSNSEKIVEQKEVCHTFTDRVWKKLEALEKLVRANGGSKLLSKAVTALFTGIGLGAVLILKEALTK